MNTKTLLLALVCFSLFHLLFNFISICIGLLIFPLYTQFIHVISRGASIEQQIANAHMIFNIGGVLLFFPFVPLIEKVLDKWIPAKGKRDEKIVSVAV